MYGAKYKKKNTENRKTMVENHDKFANGNQIFQFTWQTMATCYVFFYKIGDTWCMCN